MNDHGSDFSPDELDRLEDALAVLGEPEGRDELEALPPKLRERLGEYEAIVALAREALPLEDVPPGVLDGILAEARRSDPEPAAPRERGPGLWERLRRSFALPGLALAGTAALLLWAIQPVDEPLAPPSLSEATPSPAAPRAEAAELPAAPIQPAPAAMVEEAGAPADAKDSPIEAVKVEAEADELGAPLPGAAPRPTRSAGGAAKAKKASYEPPPPLPGLDVREESRVDADKDTVRDQLESGDRLRHQGNCGAAEREYTEVARSNGPAAERARALVGLGLCREARGDADAAQRYFDEARELDRSAEKWIRGEHEVGLKRPSKSKAATKNADGL